MRPTHWRIAGVLMAVLVLVASFLLLVAPQRKKAAALEAQTVTQNQASDQLRSKISLLKKQSKELPAKEAELAGIQQRMPAAANISSLIRAVNHVASEAGVNMTAITPGQPAAIKVAAAQEPVASGQPSASPTGEPSVEESAAPPQQATAEVMAVPLTVNACGTYAQIRDLMGELEQMKRAVLVSGVQISRGKCGRGADSVDALAVVVTANAFMLPKPSPAQASPEPTTTGSGS